MLMKEERNHRLAFRGILLLTLVMVAACAGTRVAQVVPTATLPSALIDDIDAIVAEVLEATGVPSASIAVVHDGAISLTKAYGLARIESPMPAATTMRYAIGSISKQFTATAAAMLAEDGKLSLDDTVGRFFPEVTQASDITLRQLLSHTSGIRDYWPQDYVPPSMLEPITTHALLERFASQPLDFEPGSQYQYSNTGYVLAGAIVEKVSSQSLTDFLQVRVFTPLGMESVVDIDQASLTEGDPTGYQRFALGPAREAPDEGRGWLFAAGPLAMTAEDLGRWNAAFIDGEVPGAGVVRELTREIVLDSGVGTGYGLGVTIDLEGKRRVIGHGGEVSGFTATNLIYPEERIAVTVLSNQDAANASENIADEIVEILLAHNATANAATLDQVKAIFDGLRRGTLDRLLFTPNGNHYFSEVALADIKASLKRIGSVKDIKQTYEGPRGGFTTRVYSVETKKKTLHVVTRTDDDGKLEQYTVAVE
jgi:CubicO group peptidase (beta-lactamase class C family)